MKNILFAVLCSSGRDDSYQEWVAGIFDSREDAEDAIAKLEKEAAKNKNNVMSKFYEFSTPEIKEYDLNKVYFDE